MAAAVAAADHSSGPHFVLLPFLAQGHLIPMADIGCLLAKHGAKVTILTTPLNAARIHPVVSRYPAVDVVHLDFPGADFGLPEGVENADDLRTIEEIYSLVRATLALREQVRRLLTHGRLSRPPPNCLIADVIHLWAGELARDLSITPVFFNVGGCFALLTSFAQLIHDDFEGITPSSEDGYIVVPGLPHRIEMTKAQLRGRAANSSAADWLAYLDSTLKAFRESFGAIINTFRELEPEYVAECEKLFGRKIWCVGPVSLSSDGEPNRGKKPSIDAHDFSKWLDSKEPSSVLYICLGSTTPLPTAQLIELGLALENSSHPFIWVVKDDDGGGGDLGRWISERGFEEKAKGRGIVVRGWSPQAFILSHPSVGGFLTHCGWNSTLEGIARGLPLLTWPIMLDMFCNERFVLDVIKTGVRGGSERPVAYGEDSSVVGVQAKSGDIERAIDDLMEKGGERRERARKVAMEAKRAVEEGGSSYCDVDRFIHDVMSGNNNTTMDALPGLIKE